MIEAKDIREIHRLYDEWEILPLASEARPAWTKRLKLLYGLLALIFSVGLFLIETKTWTPRGVMGLIVLFGVLALIVISMVYGLIVLLVEGFYLIKSTKEDRRCFSKDDDSDLEPLLHLMQALAKFPAETLEFVAASLEVRAKNINDRRTYLKGLAALVAAVGAFPLIRYLSGPIALHLEPFFKQTFLLGYGLAMILLVGLSLIYLIGSIWSKSLACTARALRLRQVLSQREALLESSPDSPEDPLPQLACFKSKPPNPNERT